MICCAAGGGSWIPPRLLHGTATVCLETLETGEILFFGLNVSWNIFFLPHKLDSTESFLIKACTIIYLNCFCPTLCNLHQRCHAVLTPRCLLLLSADRTRVVKLASLRGLHPALCTSVQRRRDTVLLTRLQSAVPAQGSASWPQQCRQGNYRLPVSYY